ncbi:hypothetical protein Tco_1059757, partial [Tanacetum coccineum]
VARWPEMDKWQELGRVIRAVHERQAVARPCVYTAGIGPTAAVGCHWLMLLEKGHRLLGWIGCMDWARIESSRSDAAIWA